jgi:hypothetical protein
MLIIPAALNSEAGQAGIQFFLGFDSSKQSFHSSCGGAGNFFLDSGHPALRRSAASFAVRAAPAAQYSCKERSHQERNTLRGAPGFMHGRAERLRRWLLRIRRGNVIASQRSFHKSSPTGSLVQPGPFAPGLCGFGYLD